MLARAVGELCAVCHTKKMATINAMITHGIQRGRAGGLAAPPGRGGRGGGSGGRHWSSGVGLIVLALGVAELHATATRQAATVRGPTATEPSCVPHLLLRASIGRRRAVGSFTPWIAG